MDYIYSFGLVAEGSSDHSVLKNILIGLFGNDVFEEITELQPDFGASNDEPAKEFGGWYNVFQYCRSQDFAKAFDDIQCLVIQIDTDVSEHTHFDIKQTDESGKKLTPEVLVQKVREKFEQIITDEFGQIFLEKYQDRILFAISVDEIECWLLPLYYTDNTKSKTNNCDFKLHEKAGKFEKKSIDYDKVSREYRKNKTLMKSYQENPSLKIFVETVLSKNINPLH
jgi:hypothetical protein